MSYPKSDHYRWPILTRVMITDCTNGIINSVYLIAIPDAPNITSKSENRWRPRPLEPTTIHCTAIGNPLPIIKWYGPQGAIPENGTERIKLEDIIEVDDEVRGSVITERLTLLVFNPDTDDGLYECIAENHVGNDNHFIVVEEARKYPCHLS